MSRRCPRSLPPLQVGKADRTFVLDLEDLPPLLRQHAVNLFAEPRVRCQPVALSRLEGQDVRGDLISPLLRQGSKPVLETRRAQSRCGRRGGHQMHGARSRCGRGGFRHLAGRGLAGKRQRCEERCGFVLWLLWRRGQGRQSRSDGVRHRPQSWRRRSCSRTGENCGRSRASISRARRSQPLGRWWSQAAASSTTCPPRLDLVASCEGGMPCRILGMCFHEVCQSTPQ